MTEKRLTFSQDVITQQNDKENVSDLASCLERTIVSPYTGTKTVKEGECDGNAGIGVSVREQ